MAVQKGYQIQWKKPFVIFHHTEIYLKKNLFPLFIYICMSEIWWRTKYLRNIFLLSDISFSFTPYMINGCLLSDMFWQFTNTIRVRCFIRKINIYTDGLSVLVNDNCCMGGSNFVFFFYNLFFLLGGPQLLCGFFFLDLFFFVVLMIDDYLSYKFYFIFII